MELAKPLGAWMARVGTIVWPRPISHAGFPAPPPPCRAQVQSGARVGASLAAQCGVPADPFVLARVKPTPSQVGLSRSQRALNLQGAFRVTEGMAARIEGRAVVLIDDVMTSGATANAASRALLPDGAKPVDVLVFARAV